MSSSALQRLKGRTPKNQDRLYLALSHRPSQPGYHWALLLAPKDLPASRSTDPDARCWDINNLNFAHEWQFRAADLSQYAAPSLIARVLLRKFDASAREVNIRLIQTILEALQIRQADTSFTCRVWALDGVDALRKYGLINIPFERRLLEEKAAAFADTCMALLASGELDVATQGVSAIPVLDLRGHT
ncbi:hypothetical protein DFH09DRAFT_1038276 [Mycena vulgaris]|nr:hypothetical protein DFH09DRAFT_1038276 [Mycena vulgaris]